jgi:cell filamentation protein, protein adenylyltransferase
VTEQDPYSLPGTSCLRNKLEIVDPAVLRDVEARIVSIRDVELARQTLPGEYSLEHYQQFHRHLFQDVYEWAGELRRVDITKDVSRFAHWRYISEQVSAALAELVAEGLLIGRTQSGFVARLAYYYGELNALHPFREGNGRALRAFLRQVSAAAGWRVDWSALHPESNIQAARHSLLTGRSDELEKILAPLVVRM